MSRGAPHLITTERAGADVRDRLAGPQAWLYSSFADQFGGGNPAGVVVSPVPLSDAVALAIAAVLSVPTTGFLVALEPGADEVAVRSFTPEREIDARGHVTIAVATALVEQLIWSWGEDVIVRARSGDFPLRLRDGATEMTHRLRLLEPALLGWEDVTAALGPVARPSSLPLAIAGTGLRELAIEQGVEMGRPSRVDVTVDAPDTATVRGRARKLLPGPVELWDSDGL